MKVHFAPLPSQIVFALTCKDAKDTESMLWVSQDELKNAPTCISSPCLNIIVRISANATLSPLQVYPFFVT